MNEQVIAHFFYLQVVSGGTFENEGVGVAVLIVIDGVFAMTGPEAVGVAAFPAIKAVVAGAAVEDIVATFAIQRVIAGTAVEGIVTAITGQRIITVIPEECVTVIPADEVIVAGRAVNGEFHGGDILDGEGFIVENNAEGAGSRITEIVRDGDGVVGAIGADAQVIAHFFYLQVVSGGTFEDEGVGAAVLKVIDGVFAMAGPEAVGVAAFPAIKTIIAGTAVKCVIIVRSRKCVTKIRTIDIIFFR